MSLRVLPAGAITAGVFHTFDDATLADVVTSMAALPEAAEAKFSFELSFSIAGTRATDVELTMWLTVDMPVWTQVGTRPQAEQTEWNRFLRALREHEDGHTAISRREAPVAFRRVRAASAAHINAVLESERTRIERLHRAFDNRTGHGVRQRSPHGNTVITVPP